MADDTLKLKVDGKQYEIAPDDLTLDEVELIETRSGLPIEDTNFGLATNLKSLLFIAKRRKDPRVTLEAIGNVKLSALEEPDPEPRPPKAAKKPPAAK